ncbi:MAG: hypothetical protein ACREEK_17280, partial [Bradyrhizobium sp.]
WSSPVARQAHNLKVIGSNPIPATKIALPGQRPGRVFLYRRRDARTSRQFGTGKSMTRAGDGPSVWPAVPTMDRGATRPTPNTRTIQAGRSPDHAASDGHDERFVSTRCLKLPTTDNSFTAKRICESISIHAGLLGGVVRVSSERRIFPRRYQANASQPYTLIGLTIEETSEFERLEHHSLVGDPGNEAWNSEEPSTPEQKRWLELYRKHETGWCLWLAAEGGSAEQVPRRSTLWHD